MFVLIGDGAEKARLRERQQREALANIVFAKPVPRTRISSLIGECDAGLVHLRAVPLFEGVLPSKLFEFMACASPVVLGVCGDAREVVERANCGVVVQPERPDQLAEAVLKLRNRPEAERALLGRRGREFVEREYSRDAIALRWDETLRALARRGNGR